uniref:Uncharacterized protein n=1 Tax=Rhizophora mucronata TaxID=61149 RepID=A0A2P2Q8R9_RHIMU
MEMRRMYCTNPLNGEFTTMR